MRASFAALPIEKHYLERLKELGFAEPTPVQAGAIPPMLAGKDVVVQSGTGTGKTLAYLLPILQQADPAAKNLQAVILSPTRELCMQILQEIGKLAAGTGLEAQALIGGAAISRQIDKLKLHPQIVVGTPGRILELIKLKKLSMHFVRTIVVDEVDQVFELGSLQEVEAIARSALRDRQLGFFSATVPETIADIARRWMNEPVFLQAEHNEKTAGMVDHFVFVCEERGKIDMLRRLVRFFNPKSAIVFTNEVEKIGEVLAKLKYAGLSIEALYSEAGKQERARVMKGFRDGHFQLLLATDVAARGLDLPDVTHVFHFDLPVDADHYVHRSGRTGRMGRGGIVVSICTKKERFIIEKFEKKLGIPIRHKAMYEGRLVDPEELARWKKKRTQSPRKPTPAASGAAAKAEEKGGMANRPAGKAGSGSSSAAVSPVTESAASAKKRSTERERDKKNKGAPRWLKEKWEQNREQP